MAKSFKELRREISPERINKNKERTAMLLSEMPLSELRKALEFTQKQIADELSISQAAVSKMEKKPDMYLRTLARFVKAMGGSIQITAKFPKGKVRITDLYSEEIIGSSTEELKHSP